MTRDRSAGLLVPLFSLRATGDWGIGDLSYLERFGRWTALAGHCRLQLLPVGEIPAGERSPYSALSAFAIDPIYLALPDVEDFVAAGGEAALPVSARRQLEVARAAPGIDYDAVRAAKFAALRLAFERFEEAEVARQSARAQAFGRYTAEQASWIADYALYRAVATARGHGDWRRWEPALRDRQPAAVAAAVATTRRVCRFHAYVQWVAGAQCAQARAALRALGVALDGDVPFMVAGASADVWCGQAWFDDAASLGAPPDAFNRAGQDWQLPPWHWDAMVADDFRWLRARMSRSADLFDGVRLDHVVGLFRQWVRPSSGAAGFVPPARDAQIHRGTLLLDRLRAAAPELRITAEDLGDIPDFVPVALQERGLPGYRVLRWEVESGRPRDPRAFSPCSVATWGTHDTSSLAGWWEEELDDDARDCFVNAAGFEQLHASVRACAPDVHDGLLTALYGAGSDYVLLPFPDAYAGTERINVPGIVAATNWNYRLPWRLDELDGPAGQAVAARLLALCRASHRSS